jgi:glycosyltransferase involved in cell wall biosynthesis
MLSERPGGAAPLVSVVVAARDASTTLPGLLHALERQSLPAASVEVVVVDDGSRDATAEVVRRSGIARLVRSPAPLGLPAARNLGIRAARAPVIALTDADTQPDGRWLENGLTRLEASGADILGGEIRVPLGERPSIATLLDASRFLDQRRSVRMNFGTGANLWVRREVFERAGLFNERLASYGGDDEDFGQRAHAHGARIEYAPDVVVRHPPRSELRALMRKAYRLGYGFAAQREHGFGPARERARLYRQWKLYLPRRRLYGIERLRERGYRPSLRERALMHLAQYLCVQLPRVAGDFAGERERRRRRRRKVRESGEVGAAL